MTILLSVSLHVVNITIGGGTIRDIFKEIKPKMLRKEEEMGMIKDEDVNKSYLLIPELTSVTMSDHDKGFVISSMREPCSHILSLWSFGSAGKGALYENLKGEDARWTERAYGEDAPFFDTERDISAFRDVWMKHNSVKGTIGRRFKQLFDNGSIASASPPEQVDCWVFVGDDSFSSSSGSDAHANHIHFARFAISLRFLLCATLLQ